MAQREYLDYRTSRQTYARDGKGLRTDREQDVRASQRHVRTGPSYYKPTYVIDIVQQVKPLIISLAIMVDMSMPTLFGIGYASTVYEPDVLTLVLQLTAPLRARCRAWLAAHSPQNFPMRQWRWVLFTDESRFTLYRSDGRRRVYRRRGERYADACAL